jgi:hypothetical protein
LRPSNEIAKHRTKSREPNSKGLDARRRDEELEHAQAQPGADDHRGNFIMTTPDRRFFSLAVLLLLAASAAAQPLHDHATAAPRAFDRMMAEAMSRMDKDMAIAHTGDPDRDFAAMMIPHHQGAIDMAKAELQFGSDPVLLRLAQGIIVEQQQEIEVMRRELRRLPSPPRPSTR